MRGIGVTFAVLVIVAISTHARPEALLGSDFANSYAAFAPLEALYQSFANHLFAGTDIVVPGALASACPMFESSLEVLEQDLVVQTASDSANVLGWIVRLRAASEDFCSEFSSDFAALDPQSGVSPDLEDRLVSKGLFARIHDLNAQFEEALDATLEGATSPEVRWGIGVSFAARALLATSGWNRVADNTATVFYGQAEGSGPPFPVPESVRGAMDTIVAFVGRDLGAEEIAAVRASALVIYGYLVEN